MGLKKPITLDELHAYWKQYQTALVEANRNKDFVDLFVGAFLGTRLPSGSSLAIVAIQMHIFEIAASEVETNMESLKVFFRSLDIAELEKIQASMSPEVSSTHEYAVVFVNSFVEMWNRSNR